MVARGGVGALSIIAAGDPDSMTPVPRMYMKKMAVGPVAKGRIDLRRAVSENLEAIADAFGRRVGDITAIVLDRPRHEDLIAEIREAGARIKVIADGDITATIDAAIRGTNDHLAIGIGGSFQGIISAAALQCLGGEIQGQLWPLSRTEIRQAHDAGIDDIERIFGIDDLVRRRHDGGRHGASPTATCCGACATSPRARGRTRSCSARVATACASSTRSTSSHATATRRSGCERRAAALPAPRPGPRAGSRGLPADVEGRARGGARDWPSRPGRPVVERTVAARLAAAHAARRHAENTLSLETLEQLADEAERLAADEEVRLVAITGARRAGSSLPAPT